jgi:hypothetical protein
MDPVAVTPTAATRSSPAARLDASPSARAAGAIYTVQGRTVVLPVVVRDALSISAVYVVPAGAVRRLLPTPALHVPELFPGLALCVLAAVEYRDNDLGRYNEVAVNFFVTHGGRRPLPFFGLLAGFRRRAIGAYVHRLPVTTSFSRDAGRDIWGFPKTVEEITFEDEAGWRTCTLTSGGAHVLTLSVVRGGRRRFDDLAQDAYAWRDGVLFKTPSVMGAEGVGTRLGGARLTLGAHPFADELRSLGLPKRALMSSSFERMRATFGAPQAP